MTKALKEKIEDIVFDSLAGYVYGYYGESVEDACYDLHSLANCITEDLAKFLTEAK